MDDEIHELEQQYRSVHRQYTLLLISALVLLIGGAITYRHLMNLSWVDAFYFSTVTLATVGYGDITPHTDIAKIFTIFYILFGVGIIATFASVLVRNASLKRELRRARRRVNKRADTR